MSKSAASKSPKGDRHLNEILKIRRVWWRLFFELSDAIDEYEGEEEKREDISQRMGRLIWAFNAACFGRADCLDDMPEVIAGTQPAELSPATRRKLKLVPPVLSNPRGRAIEQKPNKHRTSTERRAIPARPRAPKPKA